MRKPDSYFCDICGIAKGSTNHWRVLVIRLDGANLQIADWDRTAADAEGVKHACGNSCTQKLVERWLALKTLEAPRAAGGAA
jgi:RNA polymerase subunit RPABC4/transcription elongation factor Spt4